MLTAYLICLIFGGGILLFTIFAGGGDVDVDVDGDLSLDGPDADLNLDVVNAANLPVKSNKKGVKPWRPILEMRFWTFAVAFFGLAGVVFHFIAVTFWTEVIGAVGFGLVSGCFGSYFIHAMSVRQLNSMATPEDYLGMTAKVLLPISNQEKGKVRLIVKGQAIDMEANTNDQEELPRGAEVLVSHFDNEKYQLWVTSIKESLTEK